MGNEASQEAEEHAPIENKLEATWSHVALDTDSIPPREGHKYVTSQIVPLLTTYNIHDNNIIPPSHNATPCHSLPKYAHINTI